MKIAFPIQEDKGTQSPVFNHFGSAPLFIIMDTDTRAHETIANQNVNHTHGNCQPTVALGGKSVDAVVVGGIGKGALMKLKQAGITTYRGIDASVMENFELILSKKLPEFAMDQTCIGDHADGHCAH